MPQLAPRAAPAIRISLPVSGVAVAIEQPTGAEDLLLAEGRASDPALSLALAERLGSSDTLIDWGALPVTDIEAMILGLRQAIVGDRVTTDIICTNPACRSRIDVSFGLAAYLGHIRPKRGPVRGRSWSVDPCMHEPGWFVLNAAKSTRPRFRLPTFRDLIAVAAAPDAAGELARLCIYPRDLLARERHAVESAMQALAPSLTGPIAGRCPECCASFEVLFEARIYCLQELRERARFIYDDVDTLAERYHWSEAAILELPNERRTLYAERARQARLQ